MTTKIAPVLAGRLSSSVPKALIPPAEAPIPTMGGSWSFWRTEVSDLAMADDLLIAARKTQYARLKLVCQE
jgi:hypothetical protein